MTLVRRVALTISNAVVEYASPGCKEWAHGLAQEVAYVEGDWAALGWAFSSTRVLLDYREAPIGSLADLPAAAQRFVESKRNGNAIWIWMPIWVFIYGHKFFHAISWLERVGCGLVVLGYSSLAIIAFLEWRRGQKYRWSYDPLALIQFYKAELERVRDLYHSPRGWIACFGFAFLCVGLILGQRGGIQANPIFSVALGLLGLIVVALALWTRRTNQLRLERLDVLLGDGR